MEIKGIDVSAWQGKIDWKTVADYGMGFAILRITEAGNVVDSQFENNLAGCNKYNIPVGVYKYSYAMTIAEIQREARKVVSTLNGRRIQFPVFLDLEYNDQRSLGSESIHKMADAFREIVEAAGYKFAIYLEKKSNAYLDDFTKNAGDKNYTKFARDVNNWNQPGCQGQPWCAVYQFWKLVKVFGLTKALQIMGGGFYNCQSVTRHAKQKGTWHSTPKKGALIIFRNGSHIGSVNSYDTTYVYTNEGNTSSAPGVVANGGACRNKKYKLTDSAIDGYVWIDYGTTEDQKSTETAVQLSKVPKWVGMVNTAELNVRSWPGKENPTIKKYPYLAQNNLIDVCDTIKAADGSTWYYVRIVNKYYGFVAARYITRV